MRCPNCSEEIPEGKRFCGHCGHRLVGEAPTVGRPAPRGYGEDDPTFMPSSRPLEPEAQTILPERKEPSHRARPSVSKSASAPRPKRGRRGLFLGLAGVIIVVATLGVLWVNDLIPGIGANTPTPTRPPVVRPTSTTVPTWVSPTREEPTATSVVEPVEVNVYREEVRVSAGSPVILTFAWSVDVHELAEVYLENIGATVHLDGTTLEDLWDYWQDIEEYKDVDEDGDMDYIVRWQYPVGVLSEGTHEVILTTVIQQPITDGFDLNGDGEPDEFVGELERLCRIVVE